MSDLSSMFGGGGGGSDLSGNSLGGDAAASASPDVLGSIIGPGAFGGAGAASAAPVPAAPIAAPAPTAAIAPDVAAPTPSSVSSAASAANALPNADPTSTTIQPAITPVAAAEANPPVAPTGLSSSVTPTPALPTPQSGGILSQIFGGQGGGHGISSTALKDIIGGGALGIDLIRSGQTPPGVKSLQALAGQDQGLSKSWGAQAQGEAQGILPAGATALVQNNLNSSIAAIKGKYAQMGMSGSSAEVQDINAAKQQALAETFQIGQQMAQTGLAEASTASGQESQLLSAILAAETAQGTQLGDALAGFAGAAAK